MHRPIRFQRLLAIILILTFTPTLAFFGGAESDPSFMASYGTRIDSDEEALSISLAGTSGHPINGRWTSAITASATHFVLSLTMEKETSAAPSFGLQLAGADKKYTPYTLLSIDNENGVWLLDGTYRIATLDSTEPLDIVLDLSFVWAAAGTPGSVSASVYLDGAFLNTYEAPIALSGCRNYLNFIAGESSNQHVNAKNGEFLCDGLDGASQIFHSGDPEGYYGIVKLADMKISSGYERRSFIYYGASMRLADNAAESGLRFAFGVDKAWYDALEGASVGAILLPTDKLKGADFSSALLAELSADDYIDLPVGGFLEDAAEANDSTYVYYASLISLREANYARSFTAVGYVELSDGTRIYTASQSRSIYEVAANASASGDFVGSSYEPLLHGYLDKVVSISSSDSGFMLNGIQNYTSPYLFSETANGFSLTGNISAVKAIILDGTVYTSGWSFAGDTIQVTLK